MVLIALRVMCIVVFSQFRVPPPPCLTAAFAQVTIFFSFKKNNIKLFNFLLNIPKKYEYNSLPIFINFVIDNKNSYDVSILYNQETNYFIEKINILSRDNEIND